MLSDQWPGEETVRTQRAIRTFSKNEQLVKERRQQILAAAMKVFSAKGFKDCTVRDLSEACGLTPGGLYRYIGSKNDILRLMTLRVVGGSQRLREHAQRPDEPSTIVLRDFVAEYFRGCDTNREANLFFNREIASFDDEDRRFLMQDQVAILETIKSVIERGVEKGEFVVDSPLFVAHMILMLGHDWGLRRWFLGKHFTLEEYTEKALGYIMTALGVAQGQRSIGQE